MMPPRRRNSQLDKVEDVPRCKVAVKFEMIIVAELSRRMVESASSFPSLYRL